MSDEELREYMAETARQIKDLFDSQKETGLQIKEVGRQIGGLNNKFGSFTEGLAFPSMRKVLEGRFGITAIFPRARVRMNSEELELDVLGYVNGDLNRAVVVEVKSHLREDGVAQMLRTLERFPVFFPEHADKELVGIIAAVDVSAQVRAKVLEAGLYLALVNDEVFTLDVPEGFQHRDFAQLTASGGR